MLAIILVTTLIATTIYWLIYRPLPKINGTVRVKGLSGKVEVIRDRWGVPHIYAEDGEDLFFAQGYVHAQDRLWQMEFHRRLASGTLAEIAGGMALEVDRFARIIGFRRVAQADMALLDEQTRRYLEAYSQGVNTFIETHRFRLPLEFTLLLHKPVPWSPLDTTAFVKFMGWTLSGNWESELLRAGLVEMLGPERAAELEPAYPEGNPIIVPTEIGCQDVASTAGIPPSLPGRGWGRVDLHKRPEFPVNSTHSGLRTPTPTPTLPLAEGGGEQLYALCRPLVVGDAGVLARVRQMLELCVDLHPIADVKAAHFEPGTIDVLDLANIDLVRLKVGEVSAMAGKAAVEYVLKAGELALSGEVHAIATAPLNKEAMQLGGYNYIGHTEILADLTETPRCTTMLATGALRVVHATRHVPLRQVAQAITKKRVLETIRLTAEGLPAMGIEQPRLGVAALNPHGGEGGFWAARRLRRLRQRWRRPRSWGLTPGGRIPPIPFSFAPSPGSLTQWWPCTTTRGISR